MRKIMKQKEEGTITVFMSLILILILSLLLTIIEGARVNTTRTFAERALMTATDSLLAEYYKPLWDEYHVFGYYANQNDELIIKQDIQKKLNGYMNYTFQPAGDLVGINAKDYYNFYPFDIGNLIVDNETFLTSYQGTLFINEAVEYMKYKELGKGAELILDKFKLLEEPEKLSYVYEKKQSVEEELVEIDKGMLELMELLDGLKTSKSGIKVNSKGKLTTTDYFVKKICSSKVSMKAVEVNQKDVYQAVKNLYCNPKKDFEMIKKAVGDVDKEQIFIENKEIKYSELVDKISQKESEIKDVENIGSKTREYSSEISRLNDELTELEKSKTEIKNQLKEHKDNKKNLLENIGDTEEKLDVLFKEMKPVIQDAIACVNKLIIKTEVAKPLLQQYKTYLYSQKEKVNPDTFSGLEENYNELNNYIGNGGNGYDLKNMKKILNNNFDVVITIMELLAEEQKQLSVQDYLEAKTSADLSVKALKNYKINGLKLDYSTLVLDKKAHMDNPIEGINNLLKKGISTLVINPEDISEKKLTDMGLPSDIATMQGESEDYTGAFTEFFDKMTTNGNSSGLGEVFKSLGANSDFSTVLAGAVNSVAEKFLYLDYMKEHFYSYDNSSEKDKKPSALNYEQEYLLCENSSDAKNLSAVIMRITLLRAIMDFVSVSGDSAKRNEARVLAAALVGFTGLPILIGIVQAVILLTWSMAEALLDVCAMMMGKEIPLLKKKVILQLPEIFLINRTFLLSKAKSIPNSKEISLAYQDYLNIFLFLKNKQNLTYHAMDLIQEDIKLRYNSPGFQINQCLFGFEVKADGIVPTKFTSLNAVSNIFRNKKSGFRFSTKLSNSY